MWPFNLFKKKKEEPKGKNWDKRMNIPPKMEVKKSSPQHRYKNEDVKRSPSITSQPDPFVDELLRTSMIINQTQPVSDEPVMHIHREPTPHHDPSSHHDSGPSHSSHDSSSHSSSHHDSGSSSYDSSSSSYDSGSSSCDSGSSSSGCD